MIDIDSHGWDKSEWIGLSVSRRCCIELRQLREENAKLRELLGKAKDTLDYYNEGGVDTHVAENTLIELTGYGDRND